MSKTSNKFRLRLLSLAAAAVMLLSATSVYAADSDIDDNNEGTAEASTDEMQLYLEASGCRKGEYIVVPVCVQNNRGISVLAVEPKFDSTQLELVSALPLDLGGSVRVAGGTVVWRSIYDVSADGKLIGLVFKALADPNPAFEVSLSLDYGNAADSVWNIFVPELRGCSIPLGSCAHKFVETALIPPTCLNAGREFGSYCSECGIIDVYGETIPRLGHNYVDGVCTRCATKWNSVYGDLNGDGVTNSKDVVVLMRRIRVVNTPVFSSPDLTLDGMVDAKDMVRLFKYLHMSDEEKKGYGDKIGYSDSTVTYNSFSAAPLQADESCEHTYAWKNTVLPTCESDGLYSGYVCTKCGEPLDESFVIPAYGHSFVNCRCERCGLELGSTTSFTFSEPTWWNDDYEGEGFYVDVTLNNPWGISVTNVKFHYDSSYVKLERISALSYFILFSVPRGDNYATLGEPYEMAGSHIPYARLEFKVINSDFIRTPIWLSYDSGDICGGNGEEIFVSVQRTMVSKPCYYGHSLVTVRERIEPTCTTDGRTAETACIMCGESFESEILPALGHSYVDGFCTRCDEECPVIVGDTNADGRVNTKDLVRLMKYIAGGDVNIRVPDVNGDGKVDTRDLIRLMKIIAS